MFGRIHLVKEKIDKEWSLTAEFMPIKRCSINVKGKTNRDISK
uniref:Uncharacterized protein n=1 Tax=Rhizophora mucronata TaxID=61149 RepID=A0A2P2INZ7_RHIMU